MDGGTARAFAVWRCTPPWSTAVIARSTVRSASSRTLAGVGFDVLSFIRTSLRPTVYGIPCILLAPLFGIPYAPGPMEVTQESTREDAKAARRRLGAECGARLTAAREARGWSQAKAAEELGVARSTWSDWEGGMLPDAVRGGEIEEALGVARGAIYRAADDLAAANAQPAPADVADAPTVAA